MGPEQMGKNTAPTSAGASSGSELARTAEGTLHSTLNHSQVPGIFSNLGRESKGMGGVVILLRDRIRKHSRAQALVHELVPVSLLWLD